MKFEDFYKENFGKVVLYLMKLGMGFEDARDVAQDVFLEMWVNSWDQHSLFRLAKYRALDFFRKQKVLELPPEQEFLEISQDDIDFLLSQLKPTERAFMENFFETGQISAYKKMNWNEKQKTLAKCRKILRGEYGDNND